MLRQIPLIHKSLSTSSVPRNLSEASIALWVNHSGALSPPAGQTGASGGKPFYGLFKGFDSVASVGDDIDATGQPLKSLPDLDATAHNHTCSRVDIHLA